MSKRMTMESHFDMMMEGMEQLDDVPKSCLCLTRPGSSDYALGRLVLQWISDWHLGREVK